ncbi:MAG: hypothetical protein ACJAZP_000662 [Psychromonas sp.]|jgi:hypothetical protein|uniref:hypothetical protein n=1 Tax=Psychromonas sp. TaxID=1884585 RepID=UPI0039E24DFB
MSDSWLSKSLFFTLFFVFSAISSVMVSAEPPIENKVNQQAYEIGLMVRDLQSAIKSPQQQESLLLILNYGSDNRYHRMIRAWLFETLVVVENQLYESQNVKQQNKLQLKSDALKKAIALLNTD